MRNSGFVLSGLFLAAAMCSVASAAESTATKIARALSAGPTSVSAHATVADIDDKGNMKVLRKGTNGYTCVPGHVGVIGDDPMCMDKPSMQWGADWTAHKAKPSNTVPGVIYMLAGGTDWSATDPFATKGTPIHEPPHWMIMWPFDPKASGLPGTIKSTGTWIMYAGTPWAHLMINQKP